MSADRLIAGVMRWGKWGADYQHTQVANLIHACLECGIHTFDNADIYGGYTTESLFGKAWKESGIAREEIKIISKCGIKYLSDNRSYNIKHYDTSDKYIKQCVDNSLKELNTDYIDQMLIHRPSPLMNYDQMADTFSSITASGKVLSFGVSNFSPYQLDLLCKKYPVATNQIEISMTHILPFTDGSLLSASANGVSIQAWSPLGGGSIWHSDHHPKVDRLYEIANKYEWTIDEMAYLFLMHHHADIRPVLGTSKIERIKSAANTCHRSITNEQWFEIYVASKGSKVP